MQPSVSKHNVFNQRWSSLRPVHTYSIIARDPETGQFGGAVQSHWFCVGAGVLWAEAEVGAVATQAMADPGYGQRGLELMRTGMSASEALGALVSADQRRGVRQVAMVDASAAVAAHTGENTIPEAGHVTGEGFSVQANMMLNSTVWPTMARAFKESAGDLADRMLAALEAAEQCGGDIRGMQSAALLVVAGKSTGRQWADRIFDLRVDDAMSPLTELRRLVSVQRGYLHLQGADEALLSGDADRVEREYESAERLIGDNPEPRFWHAVALLNLGHEAEAMAILESLFAIDPNWLELALRLPVGMLKADSATRERLRAYQIRQGERTGR